MRSRTISAGAATTLFGAMMAMSVTAGAAEPQPQMPDLAGFIIGRVTIDNGSVFDLNDPREDKLLYRLANKVHVSTRPSVIEQQLLFEPGDEYSAQSLEESERILRNNRYIQNATIEPVRRDDQVVDINVETMDTWTLTPKVSFSHKGGVSRTDLGIKEMNLFGSGIGVEALYSSDVDRDSRTLKLVDKHIGDGWHSIKAVYEDNSDGFTRFLDLGKPFHSLHSTRAYGVMVYDNEAIDSLYDRGEIATQFGHQTETRELFYGWSKGLRDGWTRRMTAGLGYDQHRFSDPVDSTAPISMRPDDRKFVFPFLGIEVVQDKFEETMNVDQVARVEDRFTGTSFNARVGFASTGLGSSADALLLNAGARTTLLKSKKTSLELETEFGTRWESDGLANAALSLDARYYRRQSEKRLLFAGLRGTWGKNLDLDQQLFLGGDNGLRGYPLRYQSGDKRALLTLEERFYTNWYPFRLFRVGAAVFFDAGRTWGEGPFGTGNDGWLTDVGAGLRLGNTRSSRGGILHIDVAYPLNGDSTINNVQFVVELKQSF